MVLSLVLAYCLPCWCIALAVPSPRSNTHNNPLRPLYNTARWARMRHAVLSDQPLCVMCLSQDIVTAADTVDHIRPHKGDAVLFWDRNNLQSLCHSCHSKHKTNLELGKRVIMYDADGWPI